MIEILKKGYHKDPQIFRVGELPDHAYFIPFENIEKSRRPRTGRDNRDKGRHTAEATEEGER